MLDCGRFSRSEMPMEADARDPGSIIRFSVFELDPRAGELRKAGVPVKLQEQPCRVLQALVENAGRLVTRDELRERLWAKDTFVDFDHGVNIAIAKIRDALDDSSTRPRFIETIPRRGYRFVATVETGGASLNALPSVHPPDAVHRRQWPVWRLAAAVVALVTAALAGSAAWRTIRASVGPFRVAVLPLENLSREPETDYFADGLTDEIIHDLSLIEGLEVKSRSSSFAFKNRTRDIREVGRQLSVDLVLEGSVLRQGDRLRITADLVRVDNDATIWSASYDRDLGDVLSIQDEIARSVVNELRLKHVGGQRRYNTDVNTYDLYLRAETLAVEDAPGNAARLRRAIDLFQRVIDRQPDFAPAYAGLADAYADLRNRGQSLESSRRMRQAAEKAFELDPLLPEASAALGLVRAADLSWSDAEQSFRRALQLAPALAKVHKNFAMYVLLPEGKVAEALQHARRAASLDPLSSSTQKSLGFVLLAARRSGEAIEIAERLLALDADDVFAAQLHARALLLEGKPADALAILGRLGPPAHGYLGHAYAIVGRRDDAERLAAEGDPAAARHQVLIYSALGEPDRVLESLQKLADMDDYMADVYPIQPELTAMQNDRRLKDFRRRRNLPDVH